MNVISTTRNWNTVNKLLEMFNWLLFKKKS
jgi:uncharacterized protein (DUF1697 family)